MIAPQAISILLGGAVDSGRIFDFLLVPSCANLTDKQKVAIYLGAVLYAIHKAEKELLSSGEEVTIAKVFEWIRNLVSKRHLEAGGTWGDFHDREKVIAVLSELGGLETALGGEG